MAEMPRLQQVCRACDSQEEIRTFTTARLDDENILPSYTLLNLDPRLAALELVKKHLSLRYAELVADIPVYS
jgi:hypothetical protein